MERQKITTITAVTSLARLLRASCGVTRAVALFASECCAAAPTAAASPARLSCVGTLVCMAEVGLKLQNVLLRQGKVVCENV